MATPQLPSYGGMTHGSRYRSMFRGLTNRARGAGGRFLSGVRSVDMRVRAAGQSESLGGVAAALAGTGAAAGTLGTIDGSPVGEWLAEKTGGIVTPSRLIGALAIGARASGVDLNYSRTWTRVNNATIRAMVPVWMYGAGRRVWPAAVQRFGGGASQSANLSGVETKESVEPIPGEATIA